MVILIANQGRLHWKPVKQMGKAQLQIICMLVNFEPLTPDDVLIRLFWSRVLQCLQLKKLHWLGVAEETKKERASEESSAA